MLHISQYDEGATDLYMLVRGNCQLDYLTNFGSLEAKLNCLALEMLVQLQSYQN